MLRALADIFYGRRRNGTYDPASDRYFAIGATEQRYTDALGPYLREGRRSFARHPHFWFNNGYSELSYRGYPAVTPTPTPVPGGFRARRPGRCSWRRPTIRRRPYGGARRLARRHCTARGC